MVSGLLQDAMLEKKQLSGALRKKRINRSLLVPNDAYDGPNIYPVRTFKFAV